MLAVPCRPGTSQGLPPVVEPDPRQAAVARLRIGQRIRIRRDARSMVEGTFVRDSSGWLLIAPGEGLADLATAPRIPIADLDSLWVRGHRSRAGALAGMVAGGLALGIVCATSDCQSGQWVSALTVGVGGGAALGAGIGSRMQGWRCRYP